MKLKRLAELYAIAQAKGGARGDVLSTQSGHTSIARARIDLCIDTPLGTQAQGAASWHARAFGDARGGTFWHVPLGPSPKNPMGALEGMGSQ